MLDDITGMGPWDTDAHARLMKSWVRPYQQCSYRLSHNAIVQDALSERPPTDPSSASEEAVQTSPPPIPLHSYPVVPYRGPHAHECAVCLAPAVGVRTVLRCDHQFHDECIVQWIAHCVALGHHVRCPLCRTRIEVDRQNY